VVTIFCTKRREKKKESAEMEAGNHTSKKSTAFQGKKKGRKRRGEGGL